MKKIILFLFLISSINNFVFSQAIEKGNITIDGYVGFVSLSNSLWEKFAEDNAYDVKAVFNTPYGGRVEYAVLDRVSVGIEYNFIQRELSWKKNDTTGIAPLIIAPFTYTLIQKLHRFMPRVTVHLGSNEKVDWYIGFGLGFRFAKYSTEVDPDKPTWEYKIPGFNPIATRFAFGVKFYPIKNVGLFLEMGSPGGNLFHSGVSFKF